MQQLLNPHIFKGILILLQMVVPGRWKQHGPLDACNASAACNLSNATVMLLFIVRAEANPRLMTAAAADEAATMDGANEAAAVASGSPLDGTGSAVAA